MKMKSKSKHQQLPRRTKNSPSSSSSASESTKNVLQINDDGSTKNPYSNNTANTNTTAANSPRLYLLYGVIILQLSIFGTELITDQFMHSLLIMTDSYHHLFNACNAILLVVCFKISNQVTVKNTFGWVRMEVLGMCITITFIVALIFSLLIEGASQLVHLHEISDPTNFNVLLIFGIWSIAVNILYVLIINGVVTETKYKQTTRKERSFSTMHCEPQQSSPQLQSRVQQPPVEECVPTTAVPTLTCGGESMELQEFKITNTQISIDTNAKSVSSTSSSSCTSSSTVVVMTADTNNNQSKTSTTTTTIVGGGGSGESKVRSETIRFVDDATTTIITQQQHSSSSSSSMIPITSSSLLPPITTTTTTTNQSHQPIMECFIGSLLQGCLTPVLVVFASITIVCFHEHDFVNAIDPILGIITALVLCITFVPMLINTTLILMQTVPENVDIDKLKKKLCQKFDIILNVHELHVWQLTKSSAVATCHIVLPAQSTAEYCRLFDRIKQFLSNNYGITFVTIQPEFFDWNQRKGSTKTAHHHHHSHHSHHRHKITIGENECFMKCPKVLNDDGVEVECEHATCCGGGGGGGGGSGGHHGHHGHHGHSH